MVTDKDKKRISLNIKELAEKAESLKPFELLLIIDKTRLNNISISLDNIYNIVSKYYLKKTGLKTQNRENLYKWLKEEERYNLLNYLLKSTLHNLVYTDIHSSYQDTFVSNNFDLFCDMIEEERVRLISKTKPHPITLSKLSDESINNIITEILKKLDPSLEWLNIYNDLKEAGSIINYDKLSKDEYEELCKKVSLPLDNRCTKIEGKLCILLSNSNTLEYVQSFIREFFHYIPNRFCNNTLPRNFLREYPAIFYERYTLSFLAAIAYKNKELEYLNNKRSYNIFSNLQMISPIIDYMKMLVEGEEITEERDILRYNSKLEKYDEDTIAFLEKYHPDLVNSKKRVNNICDEVTDIMISSPTFFYLIYPYITGNFLADKTEEKVGVDDSFLIEMKYMTEHLSYLEPNEIFKELGIKKNKEIKSHNYS